MPGGPLQTCGVLAAAALLLAADVSGAADSGADGRFAERRSSHFVLRQDVDIDRRSGHDGSVRFERDVLGVLEQAHERCAEWLALRPPRFVDVWVYDPALFDAQFAALFRFPAAGFYHGAIRVRGDTRITTALVRTLHHEYLHAALDAAARFHQPPGWVNEGLAEWFESTAAGKRRLSSWEWSELSALEQAGAWLPESELLRASFVGVPPDLVRSAYLHSYARIDLLDRIAGERGLERFVDALLRTGDVERALSSVYRLGTADLDARLRAELP